MQTNFVNLGFEFIVMTHCRPCSSQKYNAFKIKRKSVALYFYHNKFEAWRKLNLTGKTIQLQYSYCHHF